MKKNHKFLVMTLFLLLSSSAFGQRVIKVIPGYLLIDTDKNLGKLNQLIKIYRQTDEDTIFIAKAKIIKFDQEKTGAKIIFIKKGYSIRVGDLVGKNGTDKIDIPLLNTNGFDTVYEESKTEKEPILFDEKQNSIKVDDDIWSDEKPRPSHSDSSVPSSFRERKDNGYIHLGLFSPGSQLDGLTNNSFSLGLAYNFTPQQNHGFMIDFTYPFLSKKSSEASSLLFILQFFDHMRLGERAHYDFGLGLYFSSSEIKSTDIKNSGTYFGFSMGFSLNAFMLNKIAFTPAIRCHTYKADETWNVFALFDINGHFSISQ